MSFQIMIEPLGQGVAARDGQTVLDACLRAGVWLPHACGHGVCGTCKVQVLDRRHVGCRTHPQPRLRRRRGEARQPGVDLPGTDA